MGAIHQALLALGATNGGGALPPDTLASIWMWGEPSREVGLSDGDPMPQLTDQTGNARHFPQPTSSQRPIYKTGILNGLACARGEGGAVADKLIFLGPDLSSLTAAHVFCIVKCDTEAIGTADNGLWRFGTAADSDHYPWVDNNIYDGCFSNVRKNNISHSGQALTSWRVVEVVSTSSEWTFKLDGTQLHTTGTNTVAGRVSTSLMSSSAGGGNDCLKGYLAGIYICSAKLSSGDRTTLVGYINDRFALSIS